MASGTSLDPTKGCRLTVAQSFYVLVKLTYNENGADCVATNLVGDSAQKKGFHAAQSTAAYDN